eukprot:jgi/Undpi1/12380/HiC_scaffold_5.g02052.m1
MSQLRAELLKMSFPRLEDEAEQDFGESTWENAVDLVIAYVGHGYDLKRRNKVKLHSGSAEANRLNKNRWRTVHVVCEQGGTPDKPGLTGPANAPVKKTTKNTTTKKVVNPPPNAVISHFASRLLCGISLGCGFLVAFNWPGNADGPTLSTTSLCLHHNVDSEDGSVEHEPPRRMDKEMTPEMVQQEEEMIRLLHFQQNDTKAIHRTVERDGLILGPRGKQQIRTMRARFGREQSKAPGGANDAQDLLLRLQLEVCWTRFTLDDKGRINRVAWALEAYKHHLALIVVVDKENYTHIAMQALLANERSEDFEFLFRVFRELIGEAPPQVILTDADPAAMAAFQREAPWSRHKLCLFNMDENVRKHGKGLGEGLLAGVIRMFHTAAFAPTEELFLQAKQDLFNLLAPGSHMYTYMAESVFGPNWSRSGACDRWVHRWAKYGHPGPPTLGINSTRRVESTNSALKPAMTRSGTLVDAHRAISKKVKEDANKTTSCWPALEGRGYDSIMGPGTCPTRPWRLWGTRPRPLRRVTTTFNACWPTSWRTRAGLLHGIGEGGDVTLTTRTSITFFAELLREQVVDRLVRVTNMYGSQTQYCHLVVLGPDGFFLCTCLRILTDGLGCRHALRAMKDGDGCFTGASIANRWRGSTEEWTMARLAAKPAVVATAGAGVPGELPAAPADPSVFTHSKATLLRVREGGRKHHIRHRQHPGISHVLENLKNHARLMVEVELRSQHDTSTTRRRRKRGRAGILGGGKAEGPAGGARTDVAGEGRQEEVGGEGRALLFQRRAFEALVGGFRRCYRRPGLAPPAGEGGEGALVSQPWACKALASGFRPAPSAGEGGEEALVSQPWSCKALAWGFRPAPSAGEEALVSQPWACKAMAWGFRPSGSPTPWLCMSTAETPALPPPPPPLMVLAGSPRPGLRMPTAETTALLPAPCPLMVLAGKPTPGLCMPTAETPAPPPPLTVLAESPTPGLCMPTAETPAPPPNPPPLMVLAVGSAGVYHSA